MERYNIPIIGVIGEQFKMTDLLMHINNAKNFGALNLLIDSPGGDVDAADKMAEALVKTGKEIHATNSGDVASAASRIFCVAPKQNRTFDPTKGQFVIHNPWANVEGDAEYMQMAAKQLKKTEDAYTNYYSERTGCDAEIVKAFMSENTPLTSEQIESLGFATIVSHTIKPVAFLNLNNNKMDEKQFSKIEQMFSKVFAMFRIKALVITDVNGNEIDFGALNAPEEIIPGVEATVNGTPAEGEYVRPDGSVLKFESGKLLDIVPPAPDEVEMLKEQIASLEAEKTAALTAQANLTKELSEYKIKAEAEFTALNSEFVKIKAHFNSNYPVLNVPSGKSEAGTQVRKPFKTK
jgi:ATP-dependent Clp protease protease subunit